MAARKELFTLKGQKGDAFSPNGKSLEVGGGFDKMSKQAWGEIRLWDRATSNAIAVLDCETNRVFSVVFPPDGKTLAACRSNGTVSRWEVATATPKDRIGKNPQGGARVAYSPDGKTLVCGNVFGKFTLRCWDPATGKEAKARSQRPAARPSP